MKLHLLLIGHILIMSISTIVIASENNSNTAQYHEKKNTMTDSALQKVIHQKLPGHRLATKNDYDNLIPQKYRGKTYYYKDFNSDGYSDWAAILVNEKKKKYGVYFILMTKEKLKVVKLLEREIAKTKGGFVKTPISFKPKGELGLAVMDYNSLTKVHERMKLSSAEAIEKFDQKHTKLTKAYQSVPALEVWTGINGQDDKSLEEMSYASTAWYFHASQLKSFRAWD